MFQSSRIASGICSRHATIASWPFSASEMSKSKPSRILRATLRITLESSTTKHVFIGSSLQVCGRARRCCDVCAMSGCYGLYLQSEYFLNIQDYEQLTFEAVDPE